MSDCDYMDLIEQYVDRFGDGPPVFELDDDEAIARLSEALDTGVPMSENEPGE